MKNWFAYMFGAGMLGVALALGDVHWYNWQFYFIEVCVMWMAYFAYEFGRDSMRND